MKPSVHAAPAAVTAAAGASLSSSTAPPKVQRPASPAPALSPGALSLDQAPPIQVPFRFFHTAPLFLCAAALLVAVAGPDALASRYTPTALAATHLVTLGFMAMVMCGALLQVMPVIVGAPVPRAALLGRWVHGALTTGTILLAHGFLATTRETLAAGACLVATSLGSFLVGIAAGLARARSRGPAVLSVAIAALGLLVTISLGLWLALARAGWAPALSHVWAELHPAWGLLAWTTVLVMAVASQVVPMFMLTPQYPRALVRFGGPALLLVLTARSAAAFWSPFWRRLVVPVLDVSLVLAIVLFALVTLWLLAHRRRKVADPTLLFWRAAMVSSIATCALWCAQPFVSEAAAQRLRLGAVTGLIVGFAVTQILGMLYRIVPFLAWFHLQAAIGGRAPVPTMKAFVTDRAARAQAWLWLGALALGALALAAVPALTRPAVTVAALATLGLSWNLAKANALFCRHLRAAAGPPATLAP